MRFSKLVKLENIFVNLEAEDREGAIREMVAHLEGNGELPKKHAEAVIDGLMERERLGTTGIGKGIAIPHVRHEPIESVLVAVGRSASGVDFASVDGERVRVIFLIIASEKQQDEYMAALRWVSSVGRDEYNNKLLSGAETAAGFLELFQDIEEDAS